MTLSFDKYLMLCGQIEKTVAQVYAHLSQSPEFDARTKKLWLEMKLEEDDHYAQIEMLRPLQRHADAEMKTVENGEAMEVLDYAKSVLKKISNPSLPKDVSLTLTLELEDVCKDFHASQARQLEDPRLERLFANLSSQDKLHADRLKEVFDEICQQDDIQTGQESRTY